jgi:hypothetical protein
VQGRLHDEEPALREQERPNVGEEGRLIRELVDHVERQGEVHRLGQPDSARLTAMEHDSRLERRALDLGADDVEHAGLQVHRQDAAGRSDEPGEIDREEARAAAEVEDRHPLPDVRPEEAERILDPPAEPVVETSREGHRARSNALAAHRSLLIETSSCDSLPDLTGAEAQTPVLHEEGDGLCDPPDPGLVAPGGGNPADVSALV